MFVVVYVVIDSVRKLLDTPSYLDPLLTFIFSVKLDYIQRFTHCRRWIPITFPS